MRCLLRGLTALAILSACAPAGAGEGVRAGASADAPRWTGLYVGGHLGRVWGNHDISSDVPGVGVFRVPAEHDGWIGGLHGGLNYQAGALVLGVEGTLALADIEGRGRFQADAIAPGLVVHSDANTSRLNSVVARVGLAQGPFLWFAKAGIARVSYDLTGYSEIGGVVLGGTEVKGTRSGATYGAGVEYALARHWTARLDYDRFDPGGKLYPIDGGTMLTLTPDYHTVRFGLSYLFGAR
jgi:opacity protein-like surface antigen